MINSKNFSIVTIFILCVLATYNFIIFSGNWGGDPEIHIIFARNLLNNGLLEFNLGYPTSGETSPLYMLIIAFFVSAIPSEFVPFAMKALGILSLLFALIISTSPIKNSILRMIIIGYCLSIPSLFFQGWMGMENMLFAAIYILFLKLIYFKLSQNSLPISIICILSLFPLILFFLRPEAFFCQYLGLFCL